MYGVLASKRASMGKNNDVHNKEVDLELSKRVEGIFEGFCGFIELTEKEAKDLKPDYHKISKNFQFFILKIVFYLKFLQIQKHYHNHEICKDCHKHGIPNSLQFK